MIIVRETFIAKPGMASKLATTMKEAGSVLGHKVHVMTDMVGDFNSVVMETEFENLGEFESRMQEYGKNKEVHKKMAGYTDMYQSGKREVYTVV